MPRAHSIRRWLLAACAAAAALPCASTPAAASGTLRRLPAVDESHPPAMPGTAEESTVPNSVTSLSQWGTENGESLAPAVPLDDWGAVVPASHWMESTVTDSHHTAGVTVGDFQVKPYGAFWADMIYTTQRTNPGAFHLFVLSAADQREPAYTIDVRRSRFGLEVGGPTLAAFGGADSGGRVEIDFHGDFITENRASVLLRHAYWEVHDDRLRFLVGQTWDVISPLNPGMIDYAVGYLAGNIGFRRAQFRGERYVDLTDRVQLTLQGALNQDVITDFPAEAGVRRESSGWPVIEGRFEFAVDRSAISTSSVKVGVSGHIGETGFDFLTAGPPPTNLPPLNDARFKTWSFNVDLSLPISDRVAVQGEFFTGANLSAYVGGIGQGVCPCLRVPIRSTGGWLDVRYDWTPSLQSNAGFGLDDPRDADSLFGRTYNHFAFANLIVELSDNLMTGIEVSARKTLYQTTSTGPVPITQPIAAGNAVTMDWTVRYEF